MKGLYICSDGRTVEGPFSPQQVYDKNERGEIDPLANACVEGSAEWLPWQDFATTHPEFFNDVVAATEAVTREQISSPNTPIRASATKRPTAVPEQGLKEPRSKGGFIVAASVLASAVTFGMCYYFFNKSPADKDQQQTQQPAKPDRAKLQEFIIEAEKLDALAEEISRLSLKEKNAFEDYRKFGIKLGEPDGSKKVREQLEPFMERFDTQRRIARVRFDSTLLPVPSKTATEAIGIFQEAERLLSSWGDPELRFKKAIDVHVRIDLFKMFVGQEY